MINNTVMLQHGSAADLMMSTVNLRLATELGIIVLRHLKIY